MDGETPSMDEFFRDLYLDVQAWAEETAERARHAEALRQRIALRLFALAEATTVDQEADEVFRERAGRAETFISGAEMAGRLQEKAASQA